MKNSDNIKKLMEKYELTVNTPVSVKEHIKKTRKSSLAAILKKKEYYGPLTSLVISVKIFARKLGISTGIISGKNIKLVGAFAAASLILITVYSLKDIIFTGGIDTGQRIILTMGDVNVMQNKTSIPAFAGTSLPGKIKLKTGPGSHLFFQNSSISITGVMENSEAEIVSGSLEKGSEISLKNGLLLSRVEKLGKNLNYIIRTPNTEVHVKGTSFSVTFSESVTKISLASGKILVKPFSGKEQVLEEGKTAIVSGNISTRKITEIELLQIKKITMLKFINGPGTITPGSMKKQSEKYEVQLQQIDKEIQDILHLQNIARDAAMEEWKKLPPLERLRRQGRIVTMFHMRDGSKIAGSINTQDESNLKLDTGNGIITIPKKDIIRRTDL